MGWLLVGIGAVLTSALVHLYTDLARSVARDYALDAANGALAGKIGVREIARIGPRRIRLEGVTIVDPQGRTIVRAGEVYVKPDLPALLKGTIHLKRVLVRDGFVHLLETPDGDLSIATAFQPKTPSTGGGGGWAPQVVIDDVAIEGIDLETNYAPVGVRQVSLHGRVKVDPSGDHTETTVHVSSGQAGIVKDGARVGRLAKLETDLRIAPGATSHARVVLTSGDDRVAVRGTTVIQPEGDPSSGPRFDARVVLDPLSPATLRRAGLADVAKQITTPVRGTIDVKGTPSDLSTSADLRTDGGPVHLAAHLTDMRDLEATVKTDGLTLSQVTPKAPAMELAGEVHARMSPIAESPRAVAVDVHDLSFGKWRVPSLHVGGSVADDHATIDEVRAPYLGGDLDVQARVGFDGTVKAKVHARLPALSREPNLRALVPGIAGALRADIDARVDASGDTPRIDADGVVRLRHARIATVHVQDLEVKGAVRGAVDQPRLDVHVSANGLAVSSMDLGQVRLAARGGPRRYEIALRASMPGERRVRLEGRARTVGNGYDLTAQLLAIGIADHDWRGRLSHVRFVPGEQVRIEGLTLASGAQRLSVSGTYGLGARGEVQAEASLQHIDLSILDTVPGVPSLPIAGLLDVTAKVDGTVDRPEITAEGALTQGKVRDVPVDSTAFYASWHPADGQVEADVQVRLGDDLGGLSARAKGSFEANAAKPIAAMKDGTYSLELRFDRLSAEVASKVAPDQAGQLPDMKGRLGGSVLFDGTAEKFSLGVVLNARRWVVDAYGPVDVDVDATYDEHAVRARVEMHDEGASLAQVWGTAKEVDLPTLVNDPTTARVQAMAAKSPWDLHVRVPPQRLDRLPSWLMQYVDVPAKAWVEADVRRDPTKPTEADLRAGGKWLGNLSVDPLGGDGCANEAEPRVRLNAEIRSGEARADVKGFLHDTPVVRVHAESKAPIDQWLEGQLPSKPPVVNGRVRVVQAELGRVPYVCQYASGRVSAEAKLEDLFAATPSAELTLHSAALHAMDSPPVEVDLDAQADTGELKAEVKLNGRQAKQKARIHATLPIVWGGSEHLVPALKPHGELHAEATLDMTPLGPLLAPVPGIGFASGMIDGHVVADGWGRDVQFDGSLALHDVAVGILATGNRFDGVEGKVRFKGQTIALDHLVAHDRDGKVTVDGKLVMKGLSPERGNLHVVADNFPVREAGMIIARVNTNARADLKLGDEEGSMQVKLKDMRVNLESFKPPKVQSLDPNPDVIVVGPGGRERKQQSQSSTEAAANPYRFVIHVDTTEPMWVRRTDMAAQLEAHIKVVIVNDARVSGRVELLRGYFELLGKRFELQQGRIQFTGGKKINPVVHLSAQYDLGGGDTLTINIDGHVMDPQLSFSSSTGQVNSLGEAASLLLGGQAGGASGQNMTQQAASVLSGVTAGILTTTLRRELGDLFPVISVQSSGTGGMVRAGISADRFIPKALEGVVKGAYVEGFVSTGKGGTQAQPQGTQAGFMIDLRFPYQLSGKLQFQPPQSWSADVLWEP